MSHAKKAHTTTPLSPSNSTLFETTTVAEETTMTTSTTKTTINPTDSVQVGKRNAVLHKTFVKVDPV